MTTIHDVARLAGVSSATVSRVLNGSTGVRDDTRERVQRAVQQLGYQPNLVGRSLRTRETHMVLVFLSTIVNSFYAKVIKGIEDVAEQNGYHIIICTTYGERGREQSYLGMLANRLVDGAIFLTTSLEAHELRALSGQHAVVQCGERVEGAGVPYVGIDNEQAAYEATCHLLDSGRNRLVHITAQEEHSTARSRLSGFRRALQKRAIPFEPSMVLAGNYGYRNAMRLVGQFLEDGGHMDGAFAISDRMAAGCIAACIAHGLRVPEDVAVTGFDNVDISYMASPTITTVSQSQYEMGAAAMDLLVRRLRGEAVPEQTLLPHKLMVRQSAPK